MRGILWLYRRGYIKQRPCTRTRNQRGGHPKINRATVQEGFRYDVYKIIIGLMYGIFTYYACKLRFYMCDCV